MKHWQLARSKTSWSWPNLCLSSFRLSHRPQSKLRRQGPTRAFWAATNSSICRRRLILRLPILRTNLARSLEAARRPASTARPVSQGGDRRRAESQLHPPGGRGPVRRSAPEARAGHSHRRFVDEEEVHHSRSCVFRRAAKHFAAMQVHEAASRMGRGDRDLWQGGTRPKRGRASMTSDKVCEKSGMQAGRVEAGCGEGGRNTRTRQMCQYGPAPRLRLRGHRPCGKQWFVVGKMRVHGTPPFKLSHGKRHGVAIRVHRFAPTFI